MAVLTIANSNLVNLAIFLKCHISINNFVCKWYEHISSLYDYKIKFFYQLKSDMLAIIRMKLFQIYKKFLNE